MRLPRLAPFSVLLFIGLLLLSTRNAAAAASSGFTIAATNVSLSDTGSGSSSYTVTSQGGFTGQVGVSCYAPGTDGSLVIPSCDVPEQFLTLPANGSVSGKMPFTPPTDVTARNEGRPNPRPTGPFAAGTLVLLGLAAARKRMRWNRAMGPLILFTGLIAGLTMTTGCGGHGGLAMSHGTFGYTIQAQAPSAKAATAYISVTVQ